MNKATRSIVASSIMVAAGFAVISSTAAQSSPQRPVRAELQRLAVGGTGREASLVVVEFAPGTAEVPHTHPGEYVAYVLDGAFEFDVAGKSTATYRAGDSFFVEAERVHSGRNVAPGTTKLLITFILEKGKPASSPVK